MPAAMKKPVLAAAAIAFALPTAACGQALPGLSASDRQQGAEANAQIVQEYGGAMRGPLADYVTRVGKRIATQSNPRTREEDYTVTLLNSTVPNAFATPGGYVYVTRGLLAIMNDEAELASVMGHEVGHVAAQHSRSRQTRAGIGGLLAGIVGAVTGSDLIGGAANLFANANVASFSRRQEDQADALGVRYLVTAGYDPYASSSMLAGLNRETQLRGQQRSGGALGNFFSTHPPTADRVRKTEALARETRIAPGTRPRNRDAYLTAINGMAYGDSPDQGIVTGTSFRHPELRLGFDAPAGFQLSNGTTAVTGRAQDGSNFVFAAGDPRGTLANAVNATFAAALNGQSPGAEVRSYTINGLETAVASTRLNTNGGAADVSVAAYRFAPNQVYVIRTVAPAGRGQIFDRLIGSVQRLSPAEAQAAAAQARRIQVVTVGPRDTLQSLAARMAVPDQAVARFQALNGVQQVRAGDRVKLIVRGS
jgi:predicted Zn-dependent protease